MEKKIIAVALVLVMMVTVFVGCGQKYKTTELNGKDYILVTDDEGNTVLNDKNQLIAIVTNKDGDVIKDENGEEQTYFIEVWGDMLGDGKFHSTYGDFDIIDGWEGNSKGYLVKKGTEEKCYLKCAKVSAIDMKTSFEAYIDNAEKQIEALEKAADEQGVITKVERGTTNVTNMGFSSKSFKFKFTDEKDNVLLYSEAYYFVHQNAIYKLEYACLDGAGYDESFSGESYFKNNFTFVEEQESPTITTSKSEE